MKKTFTLTITGNCGHKYFQITCCCCRHFLEQVNKLEKYVENANAVFSTTKKLIELEEVLPEDWVEVQHRMEYDR